VMLMRRGSVTRVAATVLGLAALGGGVFVGWQQLSVAREHAVPLDVGALFAVTGPVAEPGTTTSYGEHEGEPLELSMWEPTGGATAEGAPVVVLVHGGWVSQDWIQPTIASHAAWFAEQGYLAVSLEYPLSADEHHQWDVVEPQVACALTWVEQHAAEHGGDPGRISLVGDSVGGNVALQVAYRGAAGDLESSCGGDVPAVDAVSTLYPVASPAEFYANPDPVLGGVARDMAIAYTGGTPDGVPERYTAITPAEHLTATAPATLVVTGAADHLVPPSGASGLAEALGSVDVPHELVLLAAGEHGFDRAPSGVGTQVWRELTLQWFEQHGRAPAAP
jgi:acetyl esterase/lipase